MFIKLRIISALLTVCLVLSEFSICEAREVLPGDVLEINVYGHDDLSITTRVSSEGEISYPLLGTLEVAGMRVRELEQKIQVLLNKDYIVNPHVVVFTKEYHLNSVFIMGAVKKPTTIDLNKNNVTTVFEAISMAEGYSDSANKKKIQIIRTAPDGTKEYIDVKLNSLIKKLKSGKVEAEGRFAVKPGDVIMVPERAF